MKKSILFWFCCFCCFCYSLSTQLLQELLVDAHGAQEGHELDAEVRVGAGGISHQLNGLCGAGGCKEPMATHKVDGIVVDEAEESGR